jgi:hypothetical protein
MHGIMYQVIEKRLAVIIIIFALIMLVPIIMQSLGFSATRKVK